MRFLAAATLGLLASQARVATALTPYVLSAQLSCSNLADVVHFDYTLGGLATPPNFPGTDVYSAAFRLVKAGNSTALVGVPVTNVAAKDGMGRSEINFNPIDTTKNVPKDNGGFAFVGNTVYQLPGTMLFHQQVNGVSGVTGYFEIDNNVAVANDITCTVTANSATPNIALVPQQYTINGIPQLVINSFDTINNRVYQQLVGASTTQATQPVYNFDVSPTVNIESCFNDVDINGNPRFRVPFRVKQLAFPAPNEQGVISIAVADAFGNPSIDWSVSITEKANFVGNGFRDAAEPSILDWVQPTGIGEVFGRIDFPATAPNVTCNAAGLTNILLAIVDYSTIDVGTQVQTWHFINGAVDNGLNQDPNSRVNIAIGQLNVQAAAGQPTQAPAPAQQAARKAAAKKACAAKAAAAKKAADAAAAAAAAAAAGMDAATPCLLTVPPNPLTAQGLATPYVLQQPCNMADTAGFVQATIISPSTGKVFAYQPLVIQSDGKALIKPVVPVLPKDAVVAIWFGSNANFQKLVAANPNTLTQANCVNGAVINGALSIFGQVAACNGVNFFNAAANAVFNGLLTVPPLGNAIDGAPCPTLRSFDLVDQDQQDNLQTQYLLDANGNTALNTPSNLATLTAAATAAKAAPPTVLKNPGDNPLLSRLINPAIGCNNWEIPDLSAPGTTSVTAGIGEIFAAFRQASPVARVPAGDPMTLDGNGNPNLSKLNAYRTALAGQNAVQSLNQANTATYCKNMVKIVARLNTAVISTALKLAAGPTAGQNLFDFLVARFAAAVGPDNLMCGKLVPGLTNPLAGGAVIAAQSAFAIAANSPILAGAAAGDNTAGDPYAELSQGQITAPTTAGNAFPVAIVAGAIGGVVALIIASIVIFKVVQKRKAGNVMATTARECKV